MGVHERKARQKQELRHEILTAARELFVNEGFESVSMRRIAEKIEYSPTTIYLYFKDKADLLDCVVEETFQHLEERLAGIHRSIQDPVERLKAGLRAYIEFGTSHPSEYRVAFHIERRGDYPRCNALGQKLLDHVRQSVSDCVRAGSFPEQPVELASLHLWAAAHGITSLIMSRPDFPWPPMSAFLSEHVGVTISGLKHPPALETHA